MAVLDALRVFVEVVKAGSFTAASRRLGISKSMASKRVAALEDELGVNLLHRSTRSLHLTEAGQIYYEHGLRIRDGQRAEPIKEATLASTLQRLLLDVSHVGADVEWQPGGTGGVTLLIPGVTLSGR